VIRDITILTPCIPSPASGRGAVPNAGIKVLPHSSNARKGERESGGWG